MTRLSGTPGNAEKLIAALQTLSPSSEYARGVLDILSLLGIIHLEDSQFIPTSKVAYMLIDSLRAHLMDGVDVQLPGGERDSEALNAVDLLRAMEAERMDRVDDPSPARVVRAAQCVIKGRKPSGEEVYLMEFDEAANWFQPIGGKQKPTDPDMQATLRREISEELHLEAQLTPADIAVLPIYEGWHSTHISPTYGILTSYTIDLFHVLELRARITVNECVHWLSRAEVISGQANDGRKVSTVYVDLLGADRLDSLKPAVIL